MGFRLEVKFNRLPEMGPAVRKACGDVVRKAATDVLADAKVRCPVDTGALVNSGQMKMLAPLTAEVAFTTDYAHFVELGTVKMAAQPYLTPAVEMMREPFFQAIGAAVKRELEG